MLARFGGGANTSDVLMPPNAKLLLIT